MPKFFVSELSARDGFWVLTGENAAHANVLRLKCGDEVTLCDGSGTDYHCIVSDVSKGQVSLVQQRSAPSAAEPRVRCTVLMAYAKGDKLEHVVQKATEIGAAELVAFPCKRCVSRPEEKAQAKKLERLSRIAASAAEQSGRGIIPRISASASYAEALALAARSELSVLFYENEHAHTFRSVIEKKPFTTVSLMTGPEGGFEEAEVLQAQQAGLHICTLGNRILRCETAPLTALSALLYATGEF